MRYTVKYNRIKDLAKVRPGLSISLKEAVETGAITDTGVIPDYNNIENPESIIGRVRDNFEAVEAMRTIKSLGMKKTEPTPVQTSSSSLEPQTE